MKRWFVRKLFFSKIFDNVRKGYWLEGYNEGKLAEQFDLKLEGLENK